MKKTYFIQYHLGSRWNQRNAIIDVNIDDNSDFTELFLEELSIQGIPMNNIENIVALN